MATTVRRKSPAKAESAKKSPAGSLVLVLGGILILAIIVFSSALSGGFVNLDDPAYIRDNAVIRSLSWNNIKEIFSSFYNANYHPLTTLVYAIEYGLFKLSSAPYHFVNLLIHLANICLVFTLLDKLSQRREIAIISALLFAIHPMHVESVAWISELKDVLYALFYIGALIPYLNTPPPGSKGRLKGLTITFVLFLCSLLSKSAAVTFPLLLILFDYYKQGNTLFTKGRSYFIEKIPFFLLSIFFGIVAIYSQRSAGAINADYMVHYNLFQRFFVVSYALVFYLVKLFLPFSLSALYYAPRTLPVYYYACPLVLLLIVFIVARIKEQRHIVIFGLLFYLLSIILVVQIIPVGYAVVSERYSYIPYIGLFFIAANFMLRKGNKTTAIIPSMKYTLAGIVVFFSIISYLRGKEWNSSLTLFSDIVTKNPESPYSYFGLGKVQSENNDINGALASFTRSIELDSTLAEVYFYRGNIYYNNKNNDLALKDYQKAVQVKPDYKEAFYNIGTVYSVTNRNEEAVTNFSKAISIGANQYMYARRGTSYFNLKKYQEAVSDYTNALKIDSTTSETWYNMGAAHYNLAKFKEACDDWKKALDLGYTKADEYLKAYCK